MGEVASTATDAVGAVSANPGLLGVVRNRSGQASFGTPG